MMSKKEKQFLVALEILHSTGEMLLSSWKKAERIKNPAKKIAVMDELSVAFEKFNKANDKFMKRLHAEVTKPKKVVDLELYRVWKILK